MAKGSVNPQDLKRDLLFDQFVRVVAWFKGRSEKVTKALIGFVIVLVLAGIAWIFVSRRANNAKELLADAFRYHDAVVSNPIPAGVKGYAFTTEDEKDRAAFAAFQKAANEYKSYNGEIGRLYAAIHQLNFDPEKADATLNDLAKSESDVGAQARLLVGDRLVAAGKFDEALSLYTQLKSNPQTIPPQVIDVAIGKANEAKGKIAEAVDLYYGVANDPQWRSTPLGVIAANRLSVLAPDKFDTLPELQAASPLSASGTPFTP